MKKVMMRKICIKPSAMMPKLMLISELRRSVCIAVANPELSRMYLRARKSG